jgi:hypothetical protein|uniref:HIRAN domain-containing protein n=1 Tax=viral metagenome TaxID=1070528 RepID=A0A6C0EEA3_9ZZZZ
MQIIQLDGVFTYLNNVKNLKIDEIVILQQNKNNRINPEAIGVYANNLKIGYIPYNINQININNSYKIHKINLNKNHLQILISCNNDNSNFFNYEPNYIKKIKYNTNNIIISPLNKELTHFSKYLQRSNILLKKLGITYHNENYINLLIISDDIDDEKNNIFYTVTKKYYDTNIFKYDEFFSNKLITNQIYELFKIHRLEEYIIKNYRSIDKIIKSKNIRQKIIEELKLIIKKNILSKNIFNVTNIDVIKILILKELKSLTVDEINLSTDTYDLFDKDYFYEIFDNIHEGAFYYNHKLKIYTEIEFIKNDSIIEISTNTVNNLYILELLIKLIISNKKNIIIFNPINNLITEINCSNENLEKITNLLN